MTEERRPPTSDECALFDWFFEQWPELAGLRNAVAFDAPAEVFAVADDGYRTISIDYTKPTSVVLPSPFPGEARAEVEGHPFEALFFIGENGVMLELIWSAGTWPGRLPNPSELRPRRRD